MALWSVRRPLYKVGVIVQLLGFLLFVVGFSTPFWFYASPREGSQGLWHYCNGQCHKLQVEEEWFEAVRALLCLTLIVYLMACVLAMYGNCLKYDPLTYKHSRRIEITTATAGLMGVVCMVVYTIMMKVHYQEYSKSYFGSAYGVTMGACVLALIAAILLSATGRPLQQNFVTLTTTPVGQQYVVTYRSTSQHVSSSSAPPPTPGGFSAGGGTSAPAWNTPAPLPYQTPSYMSAEQYPHAVAGCNSSGYPTEFSNPAYPSSTPAPVGYRRPEHRKSAVSPHPPPYTFQPPSAPSSAFLE